MSFMPQLNAFAFHFLVLTPVSVCVVSRRGQLMSSLAGARVLPLTDTPTETPVLDHLLPNYLLLRR